MQGSERSDMTSVAIVGWSVFPILKRELLEKRKNSEWLQPALLKILKLIPETILEYRSHPYDIHPSLLVDSLFVVSETLL